MLLESPQLSLISVFGYTTRCQADTAMALCYRSGLICLSLLTLVIQPGARQTLQWPYVIGVVSVVSEC